MNFKNLFMWILIILLSRGLFNLFQNPNKSKVAGDQIAFAKFLSEVDTGRVVEVEIQGNSKVIYSPNNPLSCGAEVWIETENEVNIIE